jgi:leader peptidase (prepilin peptidase)/N-methyltransferase
VAHGPGENIAMTGDATAALVAAPLAGLLFGSFASLAGYRLPRGEGVVAGRSRCPACGAALAVRDLVPLVSWLALGGRCRRCRAPISPRYPLAELATAVLFTLAVLAFGAGWQALMLCGLALGLVVLTLADLESQVVPDVVLLWLLPLGLVHRALLGAPWPDTIAGALGGAALGVALRWLGARVLRREALGLGDVKLLAVAGLWVGGAVLPAFLVAAGVLGVAFGLAWRRGGGGEAFPFAPALAVALYGAVLRAAPW